MEINDQPISKTPFEEAMEKWVQNLTRYADICSNTAKLARDWTRCESHVSKDLIMAAIKKTWKSPSEIDVQIPEKEA